MIVEHKSTVSKPPNCSPLLTLLAHVHSHQTQIILTAARRVGPVVARDHRLHTVAIIIIRTAWPQLLCVIVRIRTGQKAFSHARTTSVFAECARKGERVQIVPMTLRSRGTFAE